MPQQSAPRERAVRGKSRAFRLRQARSALENIWQLGLMSGRKSYRLLVEALSVVLNAHLSGIASRDEDGIEDRERETGRPPNRGNSQSARTDGDGVGGE